MSENLLVERFVQRRDSSVAHIVRSLNHGPRNANTLCGQWAPGHSAWVVSEGSLPTCKRCEKRRSA